MSDTYFYEPSKGHGLPHSPFKTIVAPRPIGWISPRDRQGRINLAPYSFFNAFSEEPPVVGFSSYGRKDSLRNAEETGEFVANLAIRPLAEAVNLSSIAVAPGVDELAMAGLTGWGGYVFPFSSRVPGLSPILIGSQDSKCRLRWRGCSRGGT